MNLPRKQPVVYQRNNNYHGSIDVNQSQNLNFATRKGPDPKLPRPGLIIQENCNFYQDVKINQSTNVNQYSAFQYQQQRKKNYQFKLPQIKPIRMPQPPILRDFSDDTSQMSDTSRYSHRKTDFSIYGRLCFFVLLIFSAPLIYVEQ